MPVAASISNKTSKPHLEVQGNCVLSGELKVGGAKNSALVLMTAALLTDEKILLKFSDSMSPVIASESSSNNTVYVLMPMRV